LRFVQIAHYLLFAQLIVIVKQQLICMVSTFVFVSGAALGRVSSV